MKRADFTKLNLTAAIVSSSCVSRAALPPKTALASEKPFIEDERPLSGREANRAQAERGREQAEGAAAKRSADTERTAGRILVSALCGGAFTLPYPPSANNYWRTTRNGRTYVTHEARDYKATVAHVLAGSKPLVDDVSVRINLYRPAKRGDLDNCLKVLLDALKGFAFVDDKQVTHLEARRHDDKANPRAELWVTPESSGETGAGR